MPGRERHFSVTEPLLRLDRFLADMLRPDGLSREKIKQLIAQGHVHIDNQVCNSPKHILKSGQTISIVIPDAENALLPEPGELTVRYRDEYCLVLSKPWGLTVHPCPSCPSGTMVNRLLFHFPELRDMEGTRPGIVHRLDKDTSGLILVALNEKIRLALAEAFAGRRVTKEYLALVKGVPSPKEADITVPVGRHPTYKTKMAAFPGYENRLSGSIRNAHSHYRVLFADPKGSFSLVRIHIRTGRTHQIRVHMAHIGHPLWGDPLYGGPTHRAADGSYIRLSPESTGNENMEDSDMDDMTYSERPNRLDSLDTEPSIVKADAAHAASSSPDKKIFANAPQGATLIASRQMLHAFHLSFTHPETKVPLEFYDAPPSDFKDAMTKLLSMPLRVVVTGLPGCGKSALTKEMEQYGVPVWSADACVRMLYEPGNDGWILLRRRFGARFVQTDRAPVNKAELFAAMRAEPDLRREIEEMVHPLVKHNLNQFWHTAEQGKTLLNRSPFSVAEIPLFLETESKAPAFSRSESCYPNPILVCVFCPTHTRHMRLTTFRHIPAHVAETLDSWQWDASRKIRASHIVIDNSGSRETMSLAARHLLAILKAIQENRTRALVAKAWNTLGLQIKK